MRNVRRNDSLKFATVDHKVCATVRDDVLAGTFLFAESPWAKTIKSFEVCAKIVAAELGVAAFPLTLNSPNATIESAILQYNRGPYVYVYLHLFTKGSETDGSKTDGPVNATIVFDPADETYYVFAKKDIPRDAKVICASLDRRVTDAHVAERKRLAAVADLSDKLRSLCSPGADDMVAEVAAALSGWDCRVREQASGLQEDLRDEFLARLGLARLGLAQHGLDEMRIHAPETRKILEVDERTYDRFVGLLSTRPATSAADIRREVETIVRDLGSSMSKTYSLGEIKDVIDRI